METIREGKSMKATDFYSGLKKSTDIPSNKTLGFYYAIIFVSTIPVIGLTINSFLNNDISTIYTFIRVHNGNHDGLLFVLLSIISVFILIRACQSLYLAKIDYSTLKTHNFDYVTFILVDIILGCFDLLIANYDKIIKLYAIYAIVTLVVTIHFWRLFIKQFEKEDQKIQVDYICERKIQYFNSIVFSILTTLFLVITVLRVLEVDAIWAYVSLAVVICILLMINTLHSHELTFIPKIILCNDKEANDKIPNLRIDRMGREDAGQITATLVDEFKYVFEYVFGTSNEQAIKRVLYLLITSCSGFSSLGYMNFYYIKQSNGNKVGLIKIDTLFRCRIYQVLEWFVSPAIVIRQFGIGKSLKIYERFNEVLESQPQKQHKKEFELTYFVIYEEFRKKNYGTHAMNLLVNALFHSEKTNNIDCSKLILLIREHNPASLALFERKIGCARYSPEDVGYDPLAKNESVGKGIFFQYRP